MTERQYTLRIEEEPSGMLWAQVAELPGCFASGKDMDELLEAASEAIRLCTEDASSLDNVTELRQRPERGRYHVPEARIQLAL